VDGRVVSRDVVRGARRLYKSLGIKGLILLLVT
jgi:hypothetical protein